MPYGQRRRFSRRVRRVRRRPSSARRRYRSVRKTYRGYRKNLTGVGPRKMVKVRKDVMYSFRPTTSTSWNALLVGGLQNANLQGWSYYTGASTTPLDSAVDVNGSTGLSQWFNFYRRYVIHGSKIKITFYNETSVDEDPNGFLGYSIIATLVPTVSQSLAGTGSSGTTVFDSASIDPGELPYAKRVFIGSPTSGSYPLPKTMKSYVSVKKMLNIKDIRDVVSVPDAGPIGIEDPYVPAIGSTSTTGQQTQPTNGTAQNGVYWNVVFQTVAQNAPAAQIPTTSVSPGLTCRLTVTSYVEFSDRLPLVSS